MRHPTLFIGAMGLTYGLLRQIRLNLRLAYLISQIYLKLTYVTTHLKKHTDRLARYTSIGGMILLLFGCDFQKMKKSDARKFENRFLVETIESHIKRESQGKEPPGGRKDWNEKWLSQIKHLEKDEASRKYVLLIIETRKKLGLPDLPGR